MQRIIQALGAGRRGPAAEAVTIELGHEERRIRLTVGDDGCVRLAFGTGEEFRGSTADLPVAVGRAARRLLETAPSLLPDAPDRAEAGARFDPRVRFELQVRGVTYEASSLLAELRAGRSALAPLWQAVSDLTTPLIATLFGAPTTSRHEPPGLSGARSLWGATGQTHASRQSPQLLSNPARPA